MGFPEPRGITFLLWHQAQPVPSTYSLLILGLVATHSRVLQGRVWPLALLQPRSHGTMLGAIPACVQGHLSVPPGFVLPECPVLLVARAFGLHSQAGACWQGSTELICSQKSHLPAQGSCSLPWQGETGSWELLRALGSSWGPAAPGSQPLAWKLWRDSPLSQNHSGGLCPNPP